MPLSHEEDLTEHEKITHILEAITREEYDDLEGIREELLKALHSFPSNIIDLSFQNIGNQAAELLTELLKEVPNITGINLHHCVLGGDISQIEQNISDNPHITLCKISPLVSRKIKLACTRNKEKVAELAAA